jgi:multidrug efflux system outer membrane protein
VLLVAAAAVLGSGCAVGPDYLRPSLAVPQEHRGQLGPAQADSLADLPWWEMFRDPALQGLLGEAVAGNRDLRSAIARVEVARAEVGVARSPLFPSVGYEADAARAKNVVQLGDVSTIGGTEDIFFAGVNAAWELDVWGRVRRSTEAARGDLLATEAFQRGILVSLVAQVAQAYFRLLELDAELEITRRSSQAFQNTRDLFDQRFTGGVGSRLPVTRAEAARARTAARIPELEAAITATENQLSVLLGRVPDAIPRGAVLSAQALPPAVPAGLPSGLLERRPDIQQAEGSLRAANARVGVAFADFFPRIGLTGVFGTRSNELEDLASAGTDTWALVGTLAGPIFQGGLRWFRWRAAKQEWESARADYEATVLNAFREVSDVLALRERLALAREERARGVAAARDSVELSQVRYDGGLANYFEVLDAQLELFPAEIALAQTQLAEQLALVELYRTLGGGWQQPSPPAPAPPGP